MRSRVPPPRWFTRTHIPHCARRPTLPHQKVGFNLNVSQQCAEGAPAAKLARLKTRLRRRPKPSHPYTHIYVCVGFISQHALQVSLTLAIQSTSVILGHLSLSIRSGQISLSLYSNLNHLPTTQPNSYQPSPHSSLSVQLKHRQGWRVFRSWQSCF